jgi:hypothetical protein
MSTVKSKKLQVGTDATSSNNFTIYQPATPDGTLRIGVGNADSPTEVGQFNANGYKPATAPAFRVALTSDQSISSGVFTKVAFNSVDFDTTSNWDATNYRYTPNIAGYYQLNAIIRHRTDGNLSNAFSAFYKNGAEYHRLSGAQINAATIGQIYGSSGSMVVYLNGTTDYIEVYGLNSTSTGNKFGGDSNKVITVFTGVLIQQA